MRSVIPRLLVLIIVSSSIFSCSESHETLARQTKPIYWGCDPITAEIKLKEFQEGKKEPHPLDIGKYLFYTTLRFNQTKEDKYKTLAYAYLDLTLKIYEDPKYFDHNAFLYNFGHNNIKPGWWSGMANSAILLGLTYFDQTFKTDNQTIIDALSFNLATDFRNGGSWQSVGHNAGWILEYSWEGIEQASVKSVLNGFMYSLICIKAADQMQPNKILSELFTTAIAGLRLQLDNYFFKEVAWTKYDLQPTIEPPHYAIFDIMLLEALDELTDDPLPWLQANIEKRRSILKQGYKVQFVGDENKDLTALFSMIGPPHPYWIDIYPIELMLTIAGKTKKINSLPPKDFEVAIKERGFITFQLSKADFDQLSNIQVSALYIDQKQELFSYTKEEMADLIIEREEELTIEIAKIDAKYDGELKEEGIRIVPEKNYAPGEVNYRNNIAQGLMDVANPFRMNEHENLVLKVDNSLEIANHKFFLYAVGGDVYQRYYLPIPKGKNLIVLNPAGFLNFDKTKRIKRIVWQVYTSKLEEEGSLRIEGVWKTSDNFQLRNLLKDEEYYFAEKKEQGNIY